MLYAIWFLVLYSAGAYCTYKSAINDFCPDFIIFSLVLIGCSLGVTWPVLGERVHEYIDMTLPNKGESIHLLTVNVFTGMGCLAFMALPLLVAYLLTKKSNQSGALTNSPESVKAAE